MVIPRLSWLWLSALALGGLLVAPGHAQSFASPSPQQQAAGDTDDQPVCDPDAIDTTFTFASKPAGEQTVSLHFRNISNTGCHLEGQVGASFAVDGHSMNVEMCWLCGADDKPTPHPNWQAENLILLAPGGSATVDLHWAATGDLCQWADWTSFLVNWKKPGGFLFIPSNWPMHICSAVKSSGYRPGASSPATGQAREGGLLVSLLQNPLYNDEYAKLHVELTDSPVPSAQPSGCADLYSVQRAPGSDARLDPLPVDGAQSVASFTPEQLREDQLREWPSWKNDRLRNCPIAAGNTAADTEIPAADLANLTHLMWRTAPAPGQDPVFFTAETHFTVLDADTLAPNWGETVQGIRAGLSVDRTSFRVGEQVPLHLRWENVNAEKRLANGECQEPTPRLEIQDGQHRVIREIPTDQGCSGHGWGPFAIEKGKAQRIFRPLATDSNSTRSHFVPPIEKLPGPGVYYLVSVWSPRLLEPDPEASPARLPVRRDGLFGGVYATARSLPVRIEVLPAANP